MFTYTLDVYLRTYCFFETKKFTPAKVEDIVCIKVKVSTLALNTCYYSYRTAMVKEQLQDLAQHQLMEN